MKIVPVERLPRLHATPLARIVAEESRVIVDADDVHERRWRFFFEPYQALRVTTDDCFETPGQVTLIPRTIVEVYDSLWIEELAAALSRADHMATFMEKSHHFLLPLQENFMEIAAWSVRAVPIDDET